ncbi:MAG: 50S ribosomal protein L25 [Deltaproteobacteria bacterium]|jgi:large subunit ribosomal protein L25|nr:50S ribosomal protein L25 [Deltaproteobacteria bacterium]
MGLSTTLSAAAREAGSSNLAKRMRVEGRLPAVCYGDGTEPRSIDLSYNEVKKAFLGDSGNRSLFTLEVDGVGAFPALVKDMQIHPVSRKLLHVDFLKIDPAKKVTVKVPLTLTGKAAGVERGGQILQSEREITVSGLPADIPPSIVADVSPLNLGQTMHLSQVELPDTLTLVKTVDLPVAVVNIPKGLKAEAEAAQAAESEAATAAAAAKAAPAKASSKDKGDKKK